MLCGHLSLGAELVLGFLPYPAHFFIAGDYDVVLCVVGSFSDEISAVVGAAVFAGYVDVSRGCVVVFHATPRGRRGLAMVSGAGLQEAVELSGASAECSD